MSESALDLSISSYDATSQKSSRHLDHISNDSGRASSDSTLSDSHDDIKVRLRTSPQVTSIHPSFLGGKNPSSVRPLDCSRFSPLAQTRSLSELPSHIQLKNTSSLSPATHTEIIHRVNYASSNSPGHADAVPGDDDVKPLLVGDRISDARVAPIKPFNMYPVDPFNMYANTFMAGAGTLPSSPMSLQSLYDTASPVGFQTFPLTSITSHLLQRKRRAENRDSSSSTATATANSATVNTSSSSASSGSIHVNVSAANGSTMVSTSSPLSPKEEDSDGSDSEKRAKLSMDVKKDDAYWDRRRKNNEAAKRSRDARRQKEEEIAMRAAFLEQENLKLRAQVAILKNETAKLHYMLYNRM